MTAGAAMALPSSAAAGDDTELYGALEAFRQVEAERAAALQRLETLEAAKASVVEIDAELSDITRRWGDSALAVFKARAMTLEGIAAKLDFSTTVTRSGRIRRLAQDRGALNRAHHHFAKDLHRDLVAIMKQRG